MKYIFGPVKSRRLGKSLGVDIVPYKLCSLNCVYCECGKTTDLTTEIKDYVPVGDVIEELDSFLQRSPDLDVITFSGSGEPTLNKSIDIFINHLKSKYSQYKVAVLTNSTLLYMPEIRKKISQADMIFPSLDAVSSQVFEKMLRPAKGVTPEQIIEGLIALRKEYKGKIFLEIFVIEGLNDTESELKLLKEASIKINPDEIHINSLDRDSAEKWVTEARMNRLQEIKEFFAPLPSKIIAKAQDKKTNHYRVSEELQSKILNSITSLPKSLEEISALTDARVADIIKAAKELEKQGLAGLKEDRESGKLFIFKL
ncbi:MAG TPA: radical SAM protein [Spirochaetota bacterium]|nr:radical SAM protein [Spirochaetota bacterium]